MTDRFFGFEDPCSSERLTLAFPKRSGSSSAMSTKAPDSILDTSFWDTGRNASPTGTGLVETLGTGCGSINGVTQLPTGELVIV